MFLASNSLLQKVPLTNFLSSTNWTMSLLATRLPCLSSLSSLSRAFISVKSASPTPIIIMEMGREEALMIAALVASISVIIPSVMMRRTKYWLGSTW